MNVFELRDRLVDEYRNKHARKRTRMPVGDVLRAGARIDARFWVALQERGQIV